MTVFHSYDEAINWITKLMQAQGMKPGLERTYAILERLGHPQRRLKFIHVAGTNGKGSTCAFLATMIQGAGYDVGLFTSPYLEKFTNRIKYNGEDIPEHILLQLVNEIKPLADEIEPKYGALSMFEISTVLAIQYYATVSYPDFVIWETGLGGRLDATNVVIPIVSVITNIGWDHMDVLGNTIAAIAREKAGIIKAGVPVISGAIDDEAASVIRATARTKSSTLYTLNDQFRVETKHIQEDLQNFDFIGPFRTLRDVEITLNGEHQQMNVALALMAIEVLRQYYALITDDEGLYTSLKHTTWMGRLEMISRSPRILLDGAHNPEGAQALVNALQKVYSFKKLIFVVGMINNKNHHDYLRHILPIVDTLIITEPAFFKKLDVEHFAGMVKECMLEQPQPVELVKISDWKLAIEEAKHRSGHDDLIVITGSLYLLSDARAWILGHSDSQKGW